MQLNYTEEREIFYSQLKSYKVVNAKSKWAKIDIKPTETYCKLPLTPMQKKLYDYADRAIRKGMGFNINITQFAELVTGVCVYCNGDAFSVDRINSKIGYVNGNVQPICKVCNTMKYVYSESEFLNHIQKIASRFNRIRLIEL